MRGGMGLDIGKTVGILNQIVEIELAGAVRYTQYSLMVFGHGRIPIQAWMREQANEGLLHASAAGEEVTTLGSRLSLGIGPLVGAYHATVDEILQELLIYETSAVDLYRELLSVVERESVALEEYARSMIRAEELHIAEVQKMLRKRGDA
jgi:bacterioferritin